MKKVYMFYNSLQIKIVLFIFVETLKLKIMSLIGIHIAVTELENKVKEAIKGAIASKGKNKGMLKAKCPSISTPEAAAWQAIMSVANPFKVGFGHLIFMGKENREIYDYIVAKIERENIEVSQLDSDRKALEAFGIW